MEKLLEYTRLNFEIQMLKENNTFVCKSDSSEKCLCIPGVSANYILRSLYHCLKYFNASSSMKWEKGNSRYIAECYDKDDEYWFVNLVDDKEKCKYKSEICEKRMEKSFSDQEFAYYKLRSKRDLLAKYGASTANYTIKVCLLHLDEKENNKKDYLYLFNYVIKEYYAHSQFDMANYLDMLFRFYLFLFENDGKKLILSDCQNISDVTYFEYIKGVVTDYAELGKIVFKGKGVNINDAINQLSVYLGIDFDAVYNYYSIGMNTGDVLELQEIISKQFKAASEFAKNELANMLVELEYCKKGIA